MTKIILDKYDQKRILEKIEKEVLASLSSQLKNISEIRIFGSILRWEFGQIPKGKKTSSGIRYWSDIDFLIIAKEGFKPLRFWKEKFKTTYGYWFCYYLPNGIPVDLQFQGKDIKPSIPVAFAVIYEEVLKDSAKKAQAIEDGLPLEEFVIKKTYKKIY